MRRAILSGVLAAGLALPALGQDVASEDQPLSAIPWLTESLARPPEVPKPPEPPISQDAGVTAITTSKIGGTLPDAVGLLPTSITGLPADLWGSGETADIVAALSHESPEMVPALQELRSRILVAELNPPMDADASGALLQARIDKLLDIGALDQALALLDRAGPLTHELFPRYFDVALLTGTENTACQQLKVTPVLQPTYPVRIFCQARTGDWNGAVLTLTTAKALGLTTELEDALLARFLDPALFEGEELPPLPSQVTPLVFRLLDAVDTPLNTTDLPRAFAFTDLEQTRGWKAQLEAAERLTRAGAIDPARLIALYTEQRPAASGGVWTRAQALQNVEAALDQPAALSPALVAAWQAMDEAKLVYVLSVFVNGRVHPEGLTDEARAVAFKLAMLGPGYEAWALDHKAETPEENLLAAIARGQASVPGTDPKEIAVVAAFASRGLPDRFKDLASAGRKGEIILQAIDLINSGAAGEYDKMTEGLAALRALGLESVARRAALQSLILDQQG